MSDRREQLKTLFDDAVAQYSRDHKRIKLLQDADGGDLWKALASKFPKYQILTDSNWIRYIKSNITASLYTVTKSADVIPTSDSDRDICLNLSVALEHIWDTQRIGYYEFLAGNNAALTNLGLTQVVWDDKKRRVKLENINPLEFMRDPYSDNLDNAGWCCRYGTYHKNVLKNNPKYKEEMEAYLKKSAVSSSAYAPQQSWKPNIGTSKDHFLVTTFWVREDDGRISETTLVDMEHELYHNDEIKPNCFPIADLYCNIPDSRLIGVSEPASIFANNVAYNLMRSNMFTAEYKNQRPPKFIRANSGLNIADFAKHGDQADRTFVVTDTVKDAVMYHEFPKPSPELDRSLQSLVNDMQEITGVDPRYTGRDTGSIITTGGTQEMLNRVSMIDAPKVMNYEAYVNKLSLIILKFLFEFSPTRVYYVRKNDNTVKDVRVEYDILKKNNISPDDFDYTIQISSELPKNKQRVQAWADRMIEKQMQYRQNGGSNINLITEEEWLEFQSDIPYKERILERMGVQRSINAVLETSEVIQSYAQGLEDGMPDDEALLKAAESLQGLRDPNNTSPVPNTADELAYLDDEDELTNFGE